jgi:hypothetical protein
MKRFNNKRIPVDQMISKLKDQLKREQDPIERENIAQRIEHYTRQINQRNTNNK